MKRIQFYLTPAAGKRLIAKGVAAMPQVRTALTQGTVVIVAGTTNGYVAQEILTALGQSDGFEPGSFFRGVIKGENAPAAKAGNVDVVLEKGVWKRGATIFDVVGQLGEEDVILKGANAVDLATGEAAVFIGNPTGGTISAASAAAIGRRTQLILPVGVEKRVCEPLRELCALCNAPGAQGVRLWAAPGRAYTELDAIRQLSGVQAHVFGAGGVAGAEGGAYFTAEGTEEQLAALEDILKELAGTLPFTLEQEP